MNALEIRGLTKRRGDFALQGLDLTLPAGCIMGLIGENGAGKTTTFYMVVGLVVADDGQKFGRIVAPGRARRPGPG